MYDEMELPEFLRRTDKPRTKSRDRLPRPQRIVTPKGKPKPMLPKTMDATAWALLRQIEREREDKQKAKFAALRERTATGSTARAPRRRKRRR